MANTQPSSWGTVAVELSRARMRQMARRLDGEDTGCYVDEDVQGGVVAAVVLVMVECLDVVGWRCGVLASS